MLRQRAKPWHLINKNVFGMNKLGKIRLIAYPQSVEEGGGVANLILKICFQLIQVWGEPKITSQLKNSILICTVFTNK